MRWTTDSLRTTLRTQPTFVPISVRLTSTSQLSLLLLLLLWWGWGCRQVRRLILIIIIMTVLLLLLHFRMKRRRRAHRSVCPSLILRLEFPSQPRSSNAFLYVNGLCVVLSTFSLTVTQPGRSCSVSPNKFKRLNPWTNRSAMP